MASKSSGFKQGTPVQRAYTDDRKFNVRHRIHQEYTVPRLDFASWALDRIQWRGDEWVLDLGAGPGTYFEPVQARIPRGRHVAGDQSLGMIRRQQTQACAARIELANLDAQALPFPDGLFDVVLANHMLFHVPDIDAALGEIGRVLKPEGVLLATTNSVNNMPEINTLYRRAVMLLTNFKYKGQISTSNAERFSLENGSGILARHFQAIARFDLPSALVFPEPVPIIEYLDSMRELRESSLPDDISWEQFMAVMRQQVVRLVAFNGPMTVRKLSGVLVATNAGGFAAEYIRLSKEE